MASLWNRRVTALLAVLALALSVMMLLGVEKVRREARTSFANTLSGTDLIVGARSGAVQLLLYSVFRVGNATNGVTWESYQDIASTRGVAWTIPLSLGDSHRGFRVLGTTPAYFEHYRYQNKRPLRFASGEPFSGVYGAVLGAAVAEELGYQLGQEIIVAHGTGVIAIAEHDDQPFSVVGILERTGTPVDRTVHVSLEGIEAIHLGWGPGGRQTGLSLILGDVDEKDLTPKAITAFLVGVERKTAIFPIMRKVNRYREEPLLAVIPGVALQELWDLMRVAEDALRVVSLTVVVTGLVGMLSLILSTLAARRHEIAVLRSVGARPRHVFALFVAESSVLSTTGVLLGTGCLYVLLALAQPMVEQSFGLHLSVAWPTGSDLGLLGLVILSGTLVGVIPGIAAYRRSLADGLSMRI